MYRIDPNSNMYVWLQAIKTIVSSRYIRSILTPTDNVFVYETKKTTKFYETKVLEAPI